MGLFRKSDGSPRIGRRSRLAVTAVAVGVASLVASAAPASALDITFTDGAVRMVNIQSNTFRLARRDKVVGSTNLTLFSNGNFNFDVHGVNNLLARRSVAWMCVVKSRSGTAFTFSHQATIMATGYNRYDKTMSGMAPNLATDFPNLWSYTWASCSMNVSGDLRGLWDEIHPDMSDVKEVFAIVGTFKG